MFSKELRAKAGATVSNKYKIQLKKSYLQPRKSRSSHRSCSVKEGLQRAAQVFSCNVAKFLRTTILKNICEQLLLKISTPAANLVKAGIS